MEVVISQLSSCGTPFEFWHRSDIEHYTIDYYIIYVALRILIAGGARYFNEILLLYNPYTIKPFFYVVAY